MKQSLLILPTSKDIPHSATSKNAELLSRGGFVKQESAGVFSFLPLGFRVLKKVEKIVREEMEYVGMQEVLMPELISKINFETTKRADTDIAFHPSEKYILGFSHEEIATPLAKEFIKSYKNLPLALFHIQTKFRNEKRAKSGLLRGREFLMKDGYSFHSDKNCFNNFYQKVIEAYFKVFKRCSLQSYKIEAGGGIFSENKSHEFSVVCDAGEDIMVFCQSCGWAQNSEIFNNRDNKCPTCGEKIEQKKCVEVGNIFDLGQKYAQDFNLYFTDKEGHKKIPLMGCYGIGVSRLVGVIPEIHHDKNGIIWPLNVAPFEVHIISIDQNEEAFLLEKELQKKGINVLVDDRKESVGKKFADSDLIGIPLRITISKKTLQNKSVEWKKRAEKYSKIIKKDQLIKIIVDFLKT